MNALLVQRKINLLECDRQDLADFFARIGEKPFRAAQVFQWIHQHGIDSFDAMTNLGKTLRATLQDQAEIKLPEVVLEQTSHDGTRKWLLKLACGNCVETVFIPEAGRGTLCVSSQVGCSLNCTFCATARQGFNRNMTVAEIVAQLWVAFRALGDSPSKDRIITNVVFMGMGEPLLNFDNVVKSIHIMMDDFGYGLSKRRITLSTAGVIPALDRLREVCDVSLAVSLHAPNDALRNELVPLNKKYPIKDLLAACKRYVADKPHRRVTFEYVMLKGVNDAPEHARELAAILRDVPAKVNLIPFNPFPQVQFERSSRQQIDKFHDVLMAAGFTTITRKTRGDDIDAACGQLAGKVIDRTKRSEKLAALAQGAHNAT